MNNNNYINWINAAFSASIICLVISIFNVLNGDYASFCISIAMIINLIALKKFFDTYSINVKQTKSEIASKISLYNAETVAQFNTHNLENKLLNLINELEDKTDGKLVNLTNDSENQTENKLINLINELENKTDSKLINLINELENKTDSKLINLTNELENKTDSKLINLTNELENKTENKLINLINELENKTKNQITKSLIEIKELININKKEIENINLELLHKIKNIQTRENKVIKSLQKKQSTHYIDQFIQSLNFKFKSLYQKIDEQRNYLYFLVSSTSQMGIKQIQELLIPIYEKQKYLEELQQIRRGQINVEILQLKMALNELQQQQNQDYTRLNKFIIQPAQEKTFNSEFYQNMIIQELQEKMTNLELAFNQAMLEYQEKMVKLSEFEQNNLNTINILPQQENSTNNSENTNLLENYDPNSINLNSESIVVNQVNNSSEIETLNNVESLIQQEVQNHTKQIENALQSFSLQQQNIDKVLQKNSQDSSQNFEVIYYNLNQINQLMMSLESKYQSFTNINRKVHNRIKTAIAQLYNQEVKPLKETLTDLATNTELLIQQQAELEDTYQSISTELKTEINMIKEQIFTDIEKINEAIN